MQNVHNGYIGTFSEYNIKVEYHACKSKLHHLSQKADHQVFPISLSNAGQFSKIISLTLIRKSANISPQLKCDATLPCEILCWNTTGCVHCAGVDLL